MKYQQIEKVKKELDADLQKISNPQELNELKVKYLGKKGAMIYENHIYQTRRSEL